ncbi:MAG: AMP-binding protein, partial [Thermodesulfobacteriota bacterium]
MNKVRMISGLGRGFFGLIAGEVREGTLLQTLGLTVQHKRPTFANDLSHAELLERKALRNKDRPFLHFHDQTFSYRQMNENANRTAHYFSALGAGPGQGMALMMKNGPRWLDAFFGTQRLGMCAVPVNIALRGDQLAHIFNHSEARFACVDHDLLPFFEKVKDRLESPPRVIVNPQGSPSGFKLSPDQVSLEDAYGPGNRTDRPSVLPRQGDPCLLLYTSGTTGLPKGVPTRYGRTNIKIMGLLAKAMLNPEDIYFTCLPLFHANALLLTLINALSADAQ